MDIYSVTPRLICQSGSCPSPHPRVFRPAVQTPFTITDRVRRRERAAVMALKVHGAQSEKLEHKWFQRVRVLTIFRRQSKTNLYTNAVFMA